MMRVTPVSSALAERNAAAARFEPTARLGEISAALERVVGSKITLPAASGGSGADVAEAVAELTRIASARMASENSLDAQSHLSRILSALQRLMLDLHLHLMSNLSARLSGGSRALARLRTVGGSGDLLERVCTEVVRGCGFDRVVLSRVNGAVWNPWLAHSTASQELDAWFPEWVGSAIVIDSRMPEHSLLTAQRPVLVHDTATAPVHRPIIVDSGHSRSYVVAPLISQGTVIGFLHADHHSAGPRVGEVDRDVLWAFASGLGFLYERTMLQDALRAQRRQARDILLGAAESIMSFAERDAVGDAALVPLDALRARGNAAVLDVLTRREAEVLRLMAEGATNATIAERLVISSDTVKSHVKHILRKLAVRNRSQAVTHYLSA